MCERSDRTKPIIMMKLNCALHLSSLWCSERRCVTCDHREHVTQTSGHGWTLLGADHANQLSPGNDIIYQHTHLKSRKSERSLDAISSSLQSAGQSGLYVFFFFSSSRTVGIVCKTWQHFVVPRSLQPDVKFLFVWSFCLLLELIVLHSVHNSCFSVY